MVLLSSELAGLVPVSYSCGKSTRYSIRLNGFSIVMTICYKDAYVNRFPLLIVSFWNTVTEECFLLNGFKSRVQRQLLSLRSFQAAFLYFLYLCLLVYYYYYWYYYYFHLIFFIIIFLIIYFTMPCWLFSLA